jgi:hypothetical protein
VRDTSDEHAGAAALTLVEALLIHLEENGMLNGEGRDTIFESAIEAHREADQAQAEGAHAVIAALLSRLHSRSDGVEVVGEGDVLHRNQKNAEEQEP